MKCKWSHRVALLGKPFKGSWLTVALLVFSTKFVYYKSPILLSFLLSWNVGMVLKKV